MTNVLAWPRRTSRRGSWEPSSWSQLRSAALRTRYYAVSGESLHSLADATPVEAEELYSRFPEFENANAPMPRAAALGAPWSEAARVAALAPWFPIEARYVLPRFTPAELSRLKPEAIVAPIETLRALAELAIGGGLSLPALKYGAIALTGVGRGIPSEQDRDLVWRGFKVPLYTQFRGFHGELLASECALQDGLHIDKKAAVFEESPDGLLVTSLTNLRYPVLRLISGMDAALDSLPCACGSETARLTGLSAHCAERRDRLSRAALAV